MKKLALTLASLLAVSAVVSAKEVVATPVVAVEPVAIVYSEPVASEWRPTGYLDLGVKYYGEEERHSVNQNYLRTQMMGSINLTEKQNFQFRARNYANIQTEGRDGTASTASNNTRLRYYYNNGTLGNSEISLKQRVEYYNRFAGTDTHALNYQMELEFERYFDFMPTWFDVTSFAVIPKVGYNRIGTEDADYAVYGAAEIWTYTELPFGFGLEMNMYNQYTSFGAESEFMTKDGKMDDSQFDVGFEAYLYRNFDLYAEGKNKLELTTEFGYETYDLYQSSRLFKDLNEDEAASPIFKKEGRSYQAYALAGLQLSHQYSKTLKLYAWAGGEYRNWNVTSKSEASNWGWQPQVTVGFKSTF